MKVLACIILAIGSAAALRSGPYLPSGWRPDGPAFVLPSEVAKSAAINNEDPIAESEAAGSDFLREYGPPKVQDVSQDLTQQALPDVVTEQSFAVIGARFNQNDEIKEAVTEETTQQNIVTEQTVTTTESEVPTEDKAATEPEQLVRGKSLNFDEQTEASLASILEEETTEKATEAAEVTKDSENANSNIISAVEEVVEKEVEAEKKEIEDKEQKDIETEIQTVNERVEKQLKDDVRAAEEEVKEVDGGVKNIAEALVNLENEIKAQQAETVAEIKTVQENSGDLEKAPEGFLEYGPPALREYGPPKDELLRSEAVVEASPETEAVASNETRRRRFSPKFRQ